MRYSLHIRDQRKLFAVTRAADKPHSKYLHGYPIVRIDTPFDQTYPPNTLSVVKVLTSKMQRKGRLHAWNKVNAGRAVAMSISLVD